jgi:hypothetical protein
MWTALRPSQVFAQHMKCSAVSKKKHNSGSETYIDVACFCDRHICESSRRYSAGGLSRAVGPQFLLRFPEISIQLQNYNFRTDRLFFYYMLTNKECMLYVRPQNISHVPLLCLRLH